MHIPNLSAQVERPMTFLITGGAGFIGSHLAEALIRKGHRVLVLDDLSTGSIENIRHLFDNRNFHFAYSGITDEVVLDRLASQADTIVHLAAAVGVKLIVEKPVQTLETNVAGTEVLLKTAVKYRAKVLIASTSEVYGKGVKVPFNEDDDVVLGATVRSRWGYAASKLLDEFLALAYYREKELPIVIFRLFNTIGPRQTGRYGMVVPRFVRQALDGERLTVFGDGLQSRCFLHVADAVDAIIGLSTCDAAVGNVFNVGSTEETTILDLARLVSAVVGKWRKDLSIKAGDQQIVLVPYDRAYAEGFEDMQRRLPEISKIQKYTGWAPKRSLESTLVDILNSPINREGRN